MYVRNFLEDKAKHALKLKKINVHVVIQHRRETTLHQLITRMWANAQRDGRPAEHRWRPLFNAAKFS